MSTNIEEKYTSTTDKVKENTAEDKKPADRHDNSKETGSKEAGSKEIGGRDGPEPTRYGDWEVGGRCTDF